MTDAPRLVHHEDGPAQAPPLVLLNSIGTTSRTWAPCVDALAGRFRVIGVETRGHGGSRSGPPGAPCSLADLAGDVLSVLDGLGLGRVHLAGVSIGAMTAMWLAARHPSSVDRLALLCTTAHPDRARYRERAAAVRAGGMAAVAEVPGRLWITAGLAGRDPALLASLEAMQAGIDAEGYAQCCEALASTDLRPELSRITAPTLVVAGADDPAAPVEALREIAEGIADAHLRVLPDAAHIAPVEQPGQVARLLLAHFGA